MTASSWPSWDEWLNGLDPETRRRAEELRGEFARRGANDPESWARSEVSEDIAQLTGYLFLRGVWRRINSAVADALETEPARRLLTSGCDRAQLESLIRHTVYAV